MLSFRRICIYTYMTTITPNKLQKLKEHWLAGATANECARIFQVNKRTIHRYIQILGLKSRKPGRPLKLEGKQEPMQNK